MSPGKIASQASHSAVETLLLVQEKYPDRFVEYRKDGLGTKVCLAVPNEFKLLQTKEECEKSNIPCALIVDSGCSNFFDGKPTITALGIGPAKKHEVKHILKKYQLMK